MAKQRILIADDDPAIREVVRLLLEGAGYDVAEAADGPSAVEAASGAFDLIILDVMMPGCSGISACQQIRKKTMTPILFLTAKSQDADKVLGFSAGGDDYLVKPFSYSELTARVRAMVRRYREYGAAEAAAPAPQRLEFGQVCILPETGEVRLCDESLALTDIESYCYWPPILKRSFPPKTSMKAFGASLISMPPTTRSWYTCGTYAVS